MFLFHFVRLALLVIFVHVTRPRWPLHALRTQLHIVFFVVLFVYVLFFQTKGLILRVGLLAAGSDVEPVILKCFSLKSNENPENNEIYR